MLMTPTVRKVAPVAGYRGTDERQLADPPVRVYRDGTGDMGRHRALQCCVADDGNRAVARDYLGSLSLLVDCRQTGADHRRHRDPARAYGTN